MYEVILLPGSVLPAGPAYGALLEALADRVDAVAKDLEVYATDEPPAAYGLELEGRGILREADARGFDRFHLLGYSGGGAACRAFGAADGDRLPSLALPGPAWAGNQRTPAEEALSKRFAAPHQLPESEQMAEFTRLQLAPGVEPPPRPDGPPPPWLAKRPAGIRAFIRAFDEADLDPASIRRFTQPVLFVLAVRSHPDYFPTLANRLAANFPHATT